VKIDFGKTAEDYGRFRAGFPDEFFERMFSADFVHSGDRLLDIGTGTGTMARGFARRACDVTAVDPSRPLLEQAQRLDREAGIDDVTYIEGRAEAIPMKNDSFDDVTAGQCWHWFDRAKAAAEAYRVLRAGGRIIIASGKLEGPCNRRVYGN
jgi:ubiquinone/menaquinone biosynthesis C-methylase UbiE